MIPIAVICCTFGRSTYLQNALACFLNQDYDGDRELIIFNTCKEQDFVFDHPMVKVVNSKVRPATMGETRNAAIQHAKDGSLIVTLDDDNVWTRFHLRNVARDFNAEVHHWTRQDRQLYMEGVRMVGFTHGTMDTVSFTKVAWKEIGKYAPINCGEDRQFVSRLTEKFAGITVNLSSKDVSFVYAWGQGDVYHISGQGPDVPNAATGMERTYNHVMERIAALQEPTGRIVLEPKLLMDYERMAASFTGAVTHLGNSRRGKVGIVQLGHLGDILNVLPIAKHIADRWAKPMFFVSRAYSQILEGVSYVEPMILDIPDDEVAAAIKMAEQRCEVVLVLQIYGKNYNPERPTENYNSDQWQCGCMLNKFYELGEHPLVIDRRQLEREAKLIASLTNGKPMVLVNVTGGISSPFGGGQELLQQIRAVWSSKYNVVDLNKVKAERVFDIIGLMDSAALLVTNDTYSLHLAAASSVPVVGLVNDSTHPFGRPWLRTLPRYEAVLEIGYGEAMKPGNVKEIHRAIEVCQELPRRTIPGLKPKMVTATPSIILAVEYHKSMDLREDARMRRARQSWDGLTARGVKLALYAQYERTMTPRKLPMLKDVLKHAMKQAEPWDIICWTNADIVLHPEFPQALRLHIALWEVCTGQRLDFDQIPALTTSPEEMLAKGKSHLGRDIFAATKNWLEEHWDEVPDAILGSPLFDLNLAAVVRLTKGYRLTRHNLMHNLPCCELTRGYVLHESHQTKWEQDYPMGEGHQHNSRQFQAWARTRLPEMTFNSNGEI